MENKPWIALWFIASCFLIISSLACFVFQFALIHVLPLWLIALASSSLLAATSVFIMRRQKIPPKTLAFLCIDICFIAGIFLIIIGGWLSPGIKIVNPLGTSASFGYELLLSCLALVAGIAGAKDSINMYYSYSPKGVQVLIFLAVRLSAVVALLILGGILFIIIYNGVWALSWEFLTEPPRRLGQEGGISTAIIGSFWMVLGAMVVSAPLGIGAAIFLNEYSRDVRLNRLITIAVSCLNGVPSVVYGLFGLAFLVTLFGISILSGSIILGLINIPIIILTTQEALKSVPNSLREGSLALGATKWQTIKKVVLPSAMPGILTGIIMSVAKASGETAPIMWTAVTFTATPIQMVYGIFPNVFQPANNLDYHLLNLIYFLGAWDVEEKAWGTALVLLILVLSTNLLAILVRSYYRKKISW